MAKLKKITIGKENIKSLSTEETSLFLLLMQLHNEINFLTKLQFWVAGEGDVPQPVSDGKRANILLLMRLLGGKLYEGWILLENNFFRSKLSKSFEPKFDEKTNSALSYLKSYFGEKNSAEIVRNKFSFHCPINELIEEGIDTTSNDLIIYMSNEGLPNNLFLMSETILEDAIIEKLKSSGITKTITELMLEFLNVGKNFLEVVDGALSVIIDNSNTDLRPIDPEEISLNDLIPFTEIKVPWFSEILE